MTGNWNIQSYESHPETMLIHRTRSSLSFLRSGIRLGIAILTLLVFIHSTALMASDSGFANSGLQVLLLPLAVRLADAIIAILSAALVTLVYSLLIQRGSLIATTSLYPRRAIESNIGNLLDAAWPESSSDFNVLQRSIYLFNIGTMKSDNSAERVAKGRNECLANPSGPEQRRALWLTSGSALTKNVVQVLIWEWVSIWLIILMTFGTLLFNGFFSDNLNPDSYPRLTVMLIYLAAHATHFCYVWLLCLKFFSVALGGAAWSLLERAKFVVADGAKLQRHSFGTPYGFRAINKANENFVPTVYDAFIVGPRSAPSMASSFEIEDPTEVRAALATIDSTQRTERAIATDASNLALDRVMANAMVMLGITLSTAFASWTSKQLSEETPNNATTNQIGSLALLASLSLGVATMFTSAMNLNIMTTSFYMVLSLKEIHINGMAVDHYRKQRNSVGGDGDTGYGPRSVAFTQGSVPLAEVSLGDFLECLHSWSVGSILSFLLFGPAYALLPRLKDHRRRSVEADYDFVSQVSNGTVLLTTRTTDQHAKRDNGTNFDPINTCFVPETDKFGREGC